MPPPAALKPNPFVPTSAKPPAMVAEEFRPPLAEDLAKRIRASLAKLSPMQNTSTRSVIDLYYNLITTKPHLAADGDSNFPRNPKFHPVNSERFVLKEVNKPNLLIHHLGAAILGMYEVAGLIQISMTGKDPEKARVAYQIAKKSFDKVQPRVYLLENIARFGLDGFSVDGSEEDGWSLYRPAPDPTIKPPPADTNIKAADLGLVSEPEDSDEVGT